MLMVSLKKKIFFVKDCFCFVELDCPPIACGLGQFLCSHDRRCINSTRRCDGIAGMKILLE